MEVNAVLLQPYMNNPNGKRKDEWAYGQVGEAWEFLDILSKYVELKEDEYWSQEVLDLYRSSLQEN